MRKLLALILIFPLACSAQWTIGSRSFSVPSGGGGGGAITLDDHCSGTDAHTGVVSCTLNVTPGDLITVGVMNQSSLAANSVADNAGETFTEVYYTDGDSNNGFFYFQNSTGSGPVTVTFTISGGDLYLGLAAQSWKGAATTGALDTAFSPYFQVQAGSAANANCGAAKTPSMNGELIIGYDTPDNIVPTAGANFTMEDVVAAPAAYSEYWIQGTATATNAPFNNAADDWIAGCVAFKP